MKQIIRLIIAIGLFIPFLSCAQNKQSEATLVINEQDATKNENPEQETTSAEYHKISAKEAKKMLDENPQAVLVDVRSEAEFKEKHIKGAILLPLPDITNKAEEVLPDKNALILVYCRSGVRSKNASDLLVSMGYTGVCDFGGIMNWPYETE